jgi:hypothetical protein
MAWAFLTGPKENDRRQSIKKSGVFSGDPTDYTIAHGPRRKRKEREREGREEEP